MSLCSIYLYVTVFSFYSLLIGTILSSNGKKNKTRPGAAKGFSLLRHDDKDFRVGTETKQQQNNPTKQKRISFGFRYRAFQLCISLSRTCTSQIFSGFTFFCCLFLTLHSSSLQGSRPKGWMSVVPFVVVAVVGCPPSSTIPAAKYYRHNSPSIRIPRHAELMKSITEKSRYTAE